MPTTCLNTISQTDESDLNLGREIRVEITTFKTIISNTTLKEWKYAAQRTADPVKRAKIWKLMAVIFFFLFSTTQKYLQSAIIHMTLITTANQNVPPMLINRTRKGMATREVIHRFKCMWLNCKFMVERKWLRTLIRKFGNVSYNKRLH